MGEDQRLSALLKSHTGRLLAAFCAMAALALATGAYAYLLGPLLSHLFAAVSPGSSTVQLAARSGPLVWVTKIIGFPAMAWTQALPWIIGGVAAIKAVAFFTQASLMADIRERVSAHLREQMATKLLNAQPDAFNAKERGDIAARFGEDVEVVAGGAMDWVTAWVKDGTTLLVLISLAVWLDAYLAFWALVVWPLALVPLVRLGRRLRRATHKGQAEQGALMGVVVGALDARSLLRTDAELRAAHSRFRGAIQEMQRARFQALKSRAISHPLMEFLGVGGLAATLWYATGRIQDGTLTPEVFVSFFAALLMLYEPIKGLTRAYAQRQAAYAGLDRLSLLLSLPGEVGERLEVAPLRDYFALAGVDIVYEGVAILQNIHIKISANSVVVLTGPSGAGKSSILKLLAGAQQPQAGQVLWDGVDYRRLRRGSLGERVGYLDQSAPLFGRTIREHLDPSACLPDAVLWDALRAADLLDEVTARPKQLNADLQDAAHNVSGGQRRRLALARALVRRSEVLLLDEPTDAVDDASEMRLLAALHALAGRCTLVIVTHDPQQIPWADAVWEVRDGAARQIKIVAT